MEMNHINQLFANHTQVRVIIVNGFQLVGVIDDQDENAIILESGGKRKLIYKHAISTIEPT